MDNKQNINKIKRIGIDARLYGRISKGLGRYTQEVVDNIIKLDQDNKYVIFLCQENFNDFQCDDIRVKKILTDIKWYGLAEQIVMPYYIWRERLDLMHFPHFNVPIFCPVKFIVTIHDLILIKFSTPRATTLGPLVYKIKNFFYKIVISMAVKRAKKILTVSEYTKNDIVERFKVNSKKIVVTYEGVAELTSMTHSDLLGTVAECHIRHKFPNFGKFLSKISSLIYPYSLKNFIKNFLEIMKISIRKSIRQQPPLIIKQGALISQPYLLYVGNAYPHKNLEGLIKVFFEINKKLPGLKLILAGGEDYFYIRLKQYAKKFSNNIIFLGHVPDSELKALYAKAALYVFPSFYEGFGLPPIEAMAHGLVVVSSNKTCLPEILGQAALYFNPEDEIDMKNKIEQALADEKLRENLRNRGYEQAKKYSWSRCTSQTLKVYKNCL